MQGDDKTQRGIGRKSISDANGRSANEHEHLLAGSLIIGKGCPQDCQEFQQGSSADFYTYPYIDMN